MLPAYAQSKIEASVANVAVVVAQWRCNMCLRRGLEAFNFFQLHSRFICRGQLPRYVLCMQASRKQREKVKLVSSGLLTR